MPNHGYLFIYVLQCSKKLKHIFKTNFPQISLRSFVNSNDVTVQRCIKIFAHKQIMFALEKMPCLKLASELLYYKNENKGGFCENLLKFEKEGFLIICTFQLFLFKRMHYSILFYFALQLYFFSQFYIIFRFCFNFNSHFYIRYLYISVRCEICAGFYRNRRCMFKPGSFVRWKQCDRYDVQKDVLVS